VNPDPPYSPTFVVTRQAGCHNTLVITNKLTEAIKKGSFQRADTSVHEPHEPTRAEASRIHAPPLSEQQKQGLAVEGALAENKLERRLALQERYEREKAEYEASRDATLLARVEARRNVKL
jgi:hypothetical protein